MVQLDNCIERYAAMILTELKEANIRCWLAGGALRDYFMGVPVNTDYDIFFPDAANYTLAAEYFKKKGCEVVWESDNGMKVGYSGKKYDLIKKYFSSPQQTIDAFDFTVSMFAVDLERVYFGKTSFIDLAKRQLMVNKITYPASSISRAFRYYTKGFKMCKGEMKKLCEAMQNEPKKEQQPEIPEADLSGDSFFSGID